MAFAYGLNSQSTLRNVSWALRGAQLARFQEQGREVPMPFGPYLAMAGWIALLWGNDISARYLGTMG